MKIKHRLYISAIIIGVLAAFFLFYVLLISDYIAGKNEMRNRAQRIASDISALNMITYEYLLHQEIRMEKQWNLKYRSTAENIENLKVNMAEGKEGEELIKTIHADYVALFDLFSQMVSNYTKYKHQLIQMEALQPRADITLLLAKRVVSQLLIKSHSVITSSSMLAKRAENQFSETLKITNTITVLLTIILAIIIIFILMDVHKSISNPLEQLTRGAETIGTGDLLHKVDITSTDEMGELAAAFNKMVGKLKRAEESVRDTQEKLIRSEKLATIGQIAGAVGHDLRNPLGVIGNSVYFLNMKMKDVDEKVKKHLNIIQREVEVSNVIITELLDFSRIKALSFEEADVNGIIGDALSRIELSDNIAVETELDKTIPKIAVDTSLILRLCQNIVANAVQAMPEGGKLAINTGLHDSSVEISFIDSGEGIEEEYIQKIFEPLFTTRAKGIGLGLSIVKDIVEKHEGKIEVNTKLGEGTVFTVMLPLERKKD